MLHNSRIFGALLAGGIGSRMENTQLPKQFLLLGGKPIIIIALQKMLEVKEFDFIYIAIHKDWEWYLNKILNSNGIFDKRIRIIFGGNDRIDTIDNIIHYIENDEKINEDDIIVFHDAVRPFVSVKILHNCILYANKYGACNSSIPTVDTMYWSENGEKIDSTPNRKYIYHGQTPESFNLRLFKNVIEQLTAEERTFVTGIAQICIQKGIPVYMIPGDSRNIKITTEVDLLMAQALLYCLR
jgi:2-C-methyl-D-erythritol 4-phosphate cytidylyltransferase